MKELFNKHPNLIKFAMFSMVILLLMVMVAIRTGKDPGAGKTANANESSNELQNAQMRSDEQGKSSDGDDVDGVESSKTDKHEEESPVEVKEDAPDTIEPTPTPEPEMELEAFELLETDFAQLEEMIGKGIPEGRPNERYFMAPGA